MTETQRFDYRVLARVSASNSGKDGYVMLGDFEGRTADDAIRAAAGQDGNGQAGAIFIAIPLSKWHERSVTTKTQTVVEVGEVGA